MEIFWGENRRRKWGVEGKLGRKEVRGRLEVWEGKRVEEGE